MKMNNDPDMKNEVVVVGSGGRLGHAMMNRFGSTHRVTGFNHSQLDLGNDASIDAALGGLEFDHLFLAGALTAVDYCETHADEAYAVNAAGPGRIAEICVEKGAHLTYISTDMVFDGLKGGPYLETEEARPVSVYGASKLEGERRVMQASSDHLVARVSWVFGPYRPAFPEWIINQASTKSEVTLPGDKTGNPTYTIDLVEWLNALVFRAEGPARGVYHLTNSDPCTWRDWGQYCIDVAREAGLPVLAREITGVSVDSVAAFVAKRPRNSALDTEKFTRETGIRPRPWQEAIREFVVQMSASHA
jgi:dTDP-4-dehydrorhamnose reductase